MRGWVVAFVAAVAAVSACSSDKAGSGDGDASKPAATGPGVIIDTDLSLWWDDASTIGLANVLHEQGDIRLLGVVSDVPNDVAVAALDAIDTAYGHDDLPLGAVVQSDADTFEHGYTDTLVDRLPHSVESSDDVPEAVALYRQLLADEPDGSVTIVSIGGYTNLAGLLASDADDDSPLDGRELVEKKVKQTVIMDGLFPNGAPAVTNQKIDLDAAQAVVEGDWPTPIAWVDGFGGIETKVGGRLCTETDADHPMRLVYETLFGCEPPGDGNWDAPAFLYAIGDIPDAFEELGQGGAAVINKDGGLSWEIPSSRPDDVYVHITDQQALNARIDELLVASP